MSRPLNKKYFGNRNVGSASTTADDNIGGEGVASITTATRGSININDTYKNFPTLTVADPTLPNGVTATTAVTWEIESIVISNDGSGYTANQTGAAATLIGLESQADTAPVITINTDGSGNVSAISFAGGAGEWSEIDGTGITTWAIDGAGGNNAQATVKFRVKSISITEPGSGYRTAPSLSWTTLGGTTPSGQTPSLTTTGQANAAENPTGTNEDAIIGYAYIDGGREVVDIVAQKGSKRYIVKGASGTINTAMLIADTAGAEGELEIRATDSDGGTYWITKLTARLAVVEPDSGTQFASGARVKWNLSGAVEDVSVEVENA